MVNLTRVVLFSVLMISAASAAEIELPNVLIKVIDQADVPARETGVLTAVPAKEGAQVKSGETLAKLDDTDAVLADRRAEVELNIAAKNAENSTALRSAEKTLKVAEDEWKRATDLNARSPNSVSLTEVSRMQLAVEQAKLAAEKAKHETAVAELTTQQKTIEREFTTAAVDRRRIQAPFDGTVVQQYARLGEWVKAGDKLFRLIRLDRLRAEGMLDAKSASRNLLGKSVTVTVEVPGEKQQRFTGKVTFVSPEVDPFSRQARITAEIDNAGLLLQPGQKGVMRIDVGER